MGDDSFNEGKTDALERYAFVITIIFIFGKSVPLVYNSKNESH